MYLCLFNLFMPLYYLNNLSFLLRTPNIINLINYNNKPELHIIFFLEIILKFLPELPLFIHCKPLKIYLENTVERLSFVSEDHF